MNEEYMEKLKVAAKATDDMFPELLIEPLKNDFGDVYYKCDLEDLQNTAVSVDPRFTQANINSIGASTKRVDQYLEWVALYDDYVEYLISKYGSLETAEEMYQEGLANEPHLRTSHRPVLRKKSLKRLLGAGFVPSFRPYGESDDVIIDWIRHVCDIDPPDISGEEEPDIEWAMNRKMTKAEKEQLRIAEETLRKLRRKEQLQSGIRGAAIYGFANFVSGWYEKTERGVYNTEFSHGSSQYSLVEQMKKFEEERMEGEAQKIDRERTRERGGSNLYFDGGRAIKDYRDRDYAELLKYLAEYGDVDLVSALTNSGAPKSAIKAARRSNASAGIDSGLTDKEYKKLKKRHKKLDRARERARKESNALSTVLSTNKLLQNGGTIRFEDGFR